MIKDFTILGERCSGTNFLELVVTQNFKIPLVYNHGWKHFFGFADYSKNSESTLFIGIIRDPYEWINSFYRTPWHVPKHILTNKHTFLTSRFWSSRKETTSTPESDEIMYDRHLTLGRRYMNVIECRSAKLNFLVNDMPTHVDNYILIKYEDLISKYVETLTNIKNQFNLPIRNTYRFPARITTYKKTSKPFTVKQIKKMPITKADLLNHKHYNNKLERSLGYLLT